MSFDIRALLSTILTLAVFCLAVSSTSARTWTVLVDGSGDAPTIQAGIDSSATGDTVLVYPGVYQEVIDFLGKDIVVRSDQGANQTAIDATPMGGTVVQFVNGEGREATLQEFTITGGTIHGIRVEASEPTIVANIITGNYDVVSGGGISVGPGSSQGSWSPLIVDNHIHHNVSENIGGGIMVWDLMGRAPLLVEIV